MSNTTPVAIAVLVAELVPAVAFGFASERLREAIRRWPASIRVLVPASLVLPYVVIAGWEHMLRVSWFALYLGLPVVIAWLLLRASAADPEQHGNWRDALILLALGLSVDLRWFDPAWPRGWEGLGKLLLVNAGLLRYVFRFDRDIRGE